MAVWCAAQVTQRAHRNMDLFLTDGDRDPFRPRTAMEKVVEEPEARGKGPRSSRGRNG